MTLRNDARLAGVLYISYIGLNISSAILLGRAAGGADIAQRLAHIQQMTAEVRVTLLLDLLQILCAVGLAATLYRLTSGVDQTVAMIAMLFRAGEGLLGTSYIGGQVELLRLAAAAPDHAASAALFGNYIFNRPDMEFTEFCFVVGGFLFAYLFLRGRLIPSSLAWIGVISIGAQALCVPLQIAGFLQEPVVDWIWLLIMFYEIPLGLWLIARGTKTGDQVMANRSVAMTSS